MTGTPSATAFAQWIARSGYTQREVAAKLGVSEPTISRLMDGSRQPSLPLAIKISQLTGIPPADLQSGKVA